MVIKKIPEAELEVMNVIWNSGSSSSSKQIIGILEEKRCWKTTTTLTLLSRLAKKRFIIVEKGNGITYYHANVSKKNYLGFETEGFFKKFHENSLKSFITTLNENNNIHDEDIEELKEWIKNR